MLRYRRNGTANLPMVLEPKASRWYVDATETRTKLDFGGRMGRPVGERYPEAQGRYQ